MLLLLRYILIIAAILQSSAIIAQKKVTKAAPISKPKVATPAKTVCDCADAIKINIGTTAAYGPTIAPEGFGKVNEVKSKNKSDKYAFEQEHNTAWYLLNIANAGELIMEIIPKDSSNDYDFLLYKYTDSLFCKDLLNKKIKPVRSNISRNNMDIKGVTGLKTDAMYEFTGQGVHDSWSKSVPVAKGEKYVLVLDNVYPNGQGHTIKFNLVKQTTISGQVVGDNNQPIVADIVLSDNQGSTIKEIKTAADGKYSFNAELKENVDYTIAYLADSSFVDVKTINTNQLTAGKTTFTDIRTILPKLKKGEKYVVGSINFYGNEARILPESYSSAEALYRLMKKNGKMVIRIEGHVNADKNDKSQKKRNDDLSLARANSVSTYLGKKGIDTTRISTIGFGAEKPLTTQYMNEKLAAKNRRVEINVLSIE